MSQDQLRFLIRGLVQHYAAAGPKCSGGRGSPVGVMFTVFCSKFPRFDAVMTRWIYEHQLNDYDPFGGATALYKFGSLAAFNAYREERVAASARQVDKVNENARLCRAKNATAKLAKAVARGDVPAVETLLAKGAIVDIVEKDVGSLVDLAASHQRQRRLIICVRLVCCSSQRKLAQAAIAFRAKDGSEPVLGSCRIKRVFAE